MKKVLVIFLGVIAITIVGLYISFRASHFSLEGYLSLNRLTDQLGSGQKVDLNNFVAQPASDVDDEDICKSLFKVYFQNLENKTLAPSQTFDLGFQYTEADGVVNLVKCRPFVSYSLQNTDDNTIRSYTFNYDHATQNLKPSVLHYALQNSLLQYVQNQDGTVELIMNTGLPYGLYTSGDSKDQPVLLNFSPDVVIPQHYLLQAAIDDQVVGEANFTVQITQ